MVHGTRGLPPLALAALLLGACGTSPSIPPGGQTAFVHEEVEIAPVRERRLIAWEEAELLIRERNVVSVMQAHDLTVWLQGKDRNSYETTEPRIDEALRIIKELGPDAGIQYATE